VKYEYRCVSCRKSFEVDFHLGHAKPRMICKTCGNECKRVYSAVNISVQDSGVSGNTFGQNMLRRNLEAGKNMRANKAPVRRVATDFGDGDVREV
jgi:putative FmdB family regulatory protein